MARRPRRTDLRGRGDYCRSPGAGPTLLTGTHYGAEPGHSADWSPERAGPGGDPTGPPVPVDRARPWDPERWIRSGGGRDDGPTFATRSRQSPASGAVLTPCRACAAVLTAAITGRGGKQRRRAAEAACRGSPASGGWGSAARPQTAPATAARLPIPYIYEVRACSKPPARIKLPRHGRRRLRAVPHVLRGQPATSKAARRRRV